MKGLISGVLVAVVAVLLTTTCVERAQSATRTYVVRTNPLGGVTHCWWTEGVAKSYGVTGMVWIETADGQMVVVRASIVTTDAASLGVEPAKCVNGRYGFEAPRP